ncbi:MAG: hypothetical protein KIT22_14885 [Verrucomicrobiae bacterium]|nr:hypothetical protein [Verrucomicrobiae bacterium]
MPAIIVPNPALSEGFHRRHFLRRMAMAGCGASMFCSLSPARLLAATEEAAETEDNLEGPFYKPGAPVRSVLLERGMSGTPLTVGGRVLDTHGRPLKGAMLDIWHADHQGAYDNTDFQLRGRLFTDDDGRYLLRTLKPAAYGTPSDRRPAHIHVKVSAGTSRVLTTQLYFKGDPWNRHDAAVRPALILAPRQDADGLAAQFDFVFNAG